MQSIGRVVLPLRISLVALFVVLLVLQTVSLPGQFAYMAEHDPELAYLRWPLLAFSVVELACVQVVIVCTWRLLTMVRADRIFSADAFVWVNVILGAMVTAWTLFAGGAAYVAAGSDDPGLPLLLFVIVLVGGVMVLLLVVMKALLRQATTLRTDMEAVI